MMKEEIAMPTTLVKLTKKAVSDFLIWSTSRYNNYCGYGTKKENVDLVYESLLAGYPLQRYVRPGETKVPDTVSKTFTVECAGGVGENGSGRSWRTKQGGDKYNIDCEARTIEAVYSKRLIQFIK